MKKYAKIINDVTKRCDVGLGNNTTYYLSIGMTEQDVEQSYNGGWYLAGYAPVKPETSIEEQNEAIRVTREQLYVQTSDVLRNDYLEAMARGSENVEDLKQAWLESKDKIRAENPYVIETKEVQETGNKEIDE